MGRFDGRTALVIGGAQGMGRACAELLGGEGANLVLFDVEADTLATAAGELSGRGYPVEQVSGDVSQRADVAAVVARAVERFGKLDVLVHTAAIVELHPLLDFPEDRWRRIIDVNLTGVFHATQEAGRAMAKTRRRRHRRVRVHQRVLRGGGQRARTARPRAAS